MYESEDCQQNEYKYQKTDFKLPKIQRLPSRGYPKDIKSNTKLPTLKTQSNIQGSDGGTQRLSIDEDDYVGHVQKRWKSIKQQQNILQIAQSEQSDGDTFQKKIKENREIIKEVKRRNQKMKKENEYHANHGKKFSQKNKFQGLEKRNKQYREISLQNKQVAKKKQFLHNIPTKNNFKEIKESHKEIPKSIIVLQEISNGNLKNMKEVKSKDELVPFYKMLPNQLNSNRYQLSQNKKIKKQFSQKHLDNPKNVQLFDAIHNYLQNPKKSEVQMNNNRIYRQKINDYQTKLNKNTIQSQSRPKESSRFYTSEVQKENNIQMITSTHWRKIGLSDSNLMNEMSSFDKEMNRIDEYLHRNQKSLEKYIQNQKLLIDVQLSRRKGQKQRYNSCQSQKSV